jgi:hypothetical protein
MRHFRSYDTDDTSDVLIYYSPDGYTPAALTAPDPVPGAQAWQTGKYITSLRTMAAEGQPFTVRDFTNRYGTAMRTSHLYATLAALVADGLLVRTVDAHNVGVYQGVPR